MFYSVIMFVVLVLAVAIFAGAIWLQVRLCKMEKWGLALILPALCFVFSAIWLVSDVITKVYAAQFSGGAFLAAMLVFVLLNLPTAVFFFILIHEKNKSKRASELNSTKINDLE